MSQKTKMATASHSGGAGALEHLARTLHEQLAEARRVSSPFSRARGFPSGKSVHTSSASHPAATVLGATALGEFNEAAETQGGIAVSAIAGGFEVLASLELGIKEDVEGTVERCLADMDQERLSPYAYKTAILLLDGLAGEGEERRSLRHLPSATAIASRAAALAKTSRPARPQWPSTSVPLRRTASSSH